VKTSTIVGAALIGAALAYLLKEPAMTAIGFAGNKGTVDRWANTYGIKPVWCYGLVEQESGWKPSSLRMEPAYKWLPDGYPKNRVPRSYGLTQIMDAVAYEMGYRPTTDGNFDGLFDPDTNCQYGLKLFARHLKTLSLKDALAKYNSGRILSDPKIPAFTRDKYVPQVMARIENYESKGYA